MAALLPDLSVMNDENTVSIFNRRQPMRDNQRSAVFQKLLESVLNQHLGFRIYGTGRFIENENLRIEGQRPSKREQLPIRQSVDERRDVRAVRSLDHLFLADPRIAQCNIRGDIAGK